MPTWSALIVQVPAETKVSVPPVVTVQTPIVVEVKLTVKPEVDEAVSVGVVPKLCGPGVVNVIVCEVFAVLVKAKVDEVNEPELAVTL